MTTQSKMDEFCLDSLTAISNYMRAKARDVPPGSPEHEAFVLAQFKLGEAAGLILKAFGRVPR